MDFEGVTAFKLPLQEIDEIWEQWNQSNELLPGTNLPLALKQAQHEADGEGELKPVYDADFKCLYEVPSHLLVHVPSQRLNITRLVLCRNYKPYEPDSCKMGENCKFVHADVHLTTLDAYPIHVNYIWNNEGACTYKCLPPGEVVEVLSSDMCTVETYPSERILLTSGALARHDMAEPLIRCKYYDSNQTCFTGERCSFVHVMYVDPNVQSLFKRAPKAPTIGTGNPSRKSSPHITCPGDKRNNKENSNNNKTKNGKANLKTNSHAAENPSGVQTNSSNWVPNVNSPSFEPKGVNPVNLPYGFNTGLTFPPPGGTMTCQDPSVAMGGVISAGCGGTMPSMVSNGGSAPQNPFTYSEHTEGNLQELLDLIQPSKQPTGNGIATLDSQNSGGSTAALSGMRAQEISDGNLGLTNNSTLNQEQFGTALSQILSLLKQRIALPRNISVSPSPLLDEPYSLGALLYLPTGSTEAIPLQSVYDKSFLEVVRALGSQQQRPVQTVMQPTASTMPQSVSTLGGGASSGYAYPFIPTNNAGLISNGMVNGCGNGVGGGANGGASTTDVYGKVLQQLQGALGSGTTGWMRGT